MVKKGFVEKSITPGGEFTVRSDTGKVIETGRFTDNARTFEIRDEGGKVISKTPVKPLRSRNRRSSTPKLVRVNKFDDKIISELKTAGASEEKIKELQTQFTQQEIQQNLTQRLDTGPQAQLAQLLQSREQREFQQQLANYEAKQQAFEQDVEKFNEKVEGKKFTSSQAKQLEKEQEKLRLQAIQLERDRQKLLVEEEKTKQELNKIQASYVKQKGISDVTQTLIPATRTIDEIIPKVSLPNQAPEEIFLREGATTLTGTTFKKKPGQEFTKLQDTIFESDKGETITLKEFEKAQASFRQSATESKVTPLDLMFFAPGLAGRTSKGITQILSGVSKPLIRVSGSLAKTSVGTKIVSSKPIQKISDFIKPEITFKRISPIQEKRIIRSGKDFFVSGKGTIKYEIKGPIAKLLKRPAKLVDTPVSFKFDVSQLVSKTGSIGKRRPSGSPFSLKDLIPDDRLQSLIRSQTQATKALKGQAGFDLQGKVVVGSGKTKDLRLIRERADVFVKSPRVRTAPSGLEGTQTSLSAKLRSFGDESFARIRVKAADLSDDVSLFRQNIRIKGGPKIDVKGVAGRGEAPRVFNNKEYLKFISEFSKKSKKIVPGKVNKDFFKSLRISNTGSDVVSNISKNIGKTGTQTISKPVTKVSSVVKQAKLVVSQKVGESAKQSIVESARTSQINSFVRAAKTATQVSTRTFAPEIVAQPRLATQQINIALPKQSSATGLLSSEDYNLGEATKNVVGLKSINKLATDVNVASDIQTKQNSLLKQASQTRQAQQLKQISAVKTLLKQPSLVTPRTGLIPKIPIPPIIPIPTFKFGVPTLGKSISKRRKDAFNVFVKRGRKFVPIAKDLPRNKAFRKGAIEVDNTTSRSFKLVKSGTTTKKDIVSNPLLNKFRKPVGKSLLPGGTFVEKNPFNIDTIGEKKGIPGKARIINLTKPQKSKKKRKALRQKRRK